MSRKVETRMAWGNLALLVVIFAAYPILAEDAKANEDKAQYASMAPLDQYLMNRDDEVALARSAAPIAISRDATVLVLTPHGYESAVEGKNGFVCIVERLWTSPFDDLDFWNPKGRGPICYNPAAARSVLLYTLNRTKLALAGLTKQQMLERVKNQLAGKELPNPEPGAMSYMLSKQGYLNDQAGHWVPHLMFHIPKTDAATWGANVEGSPVILPPHSVPEPETIFLVPVAEWSDGTASPPM